MTEAQAVKWMLRHGGQANFKRAGDHAMPDALVCISINGTRWPLPGQGPTLAKAIRNLWIRNRKPRQ